MYQNMVLQYIGKVVENNIYYIKIYCTIRFRVIAAFHKPFELAASVL